ncbi:recombinase RecT [Paenarthrobacter nicotinovorans]|uniref:recombinase RecT n=1 Tax=Paenarthrobacter nicotinovorans TaxID=29320 RepID=UPI00382AB70D
MSSALAEATASKAVAQQKAPTARDLIQAQQPAIEAQLAGAMNSAAFVRAALSSVSNDAKLQQATPTSLLGGIMLAAQLKLEIGPALGHFYLTPRQVSRKDENDQWIKVWTCLPIIGYQGYIELAYRSGRIEKIETFLIRKGDKFDHGANSERGRFFDWSPADYDEKREWTGVVGIAKIKGAGTVWAYLPKEKVLERRPDRWLKTPWETNEEEMARKTGIRALAPYLPKSTELGKAIEADEHKVEHIAGVHDLVVSNVEDEPAEAPEQ